jgi:hypothetical protein
MVALLPIQYGVVTGCAHESSAQFLGGMRTFCERNTIAFPSLCCAMLRMANDAVSGTIKCNDDYHYFHECINFFPMKRRSAYSLLVLQYCVLYVCVYIYMHAFLDRGGFTLLAVYMKFIKIYKYSTKNSKSSIRKTIEFISATQFHFTHIRRKRDKKN